jgi:hypothetical protein
MVTAFLGLLAAGLAACSAAGSTTTPSGSAVPSPAASLPPAGIILGKLSFSSTQTALFTTRGGSLFVLLISPPPSSALTIERLDPSGALASKRHPFALTYDLSDLSSGPDGVYAGTAVIRRFTESPARLLRIDPYSLAIVAQASFPGSVATLAEGSFLWAALGDGRLVRLNPQTLAIEASRQLLPADEMSVKILSKPALGLGSLWLLAGNESDLELLRCDPTTMAVLSQTRVPTGDDLAQALNRVVANAGHVYLTGSAIVAVDRSGKLIRRPTLVPDLAGATTYRADLVGLTDSQPALVLLGSDGRILALTALHDAGGQLVISGRNAWFLGDAGHGNGIIDVRLRAVPAS